MTIIIDNTGAPWDPDVPPTAEDFHAAARAEMSAREARAVQGTTGLVAAEAERENVRRAAAQSRHYQAVRDAAGGPGVSTDLRGPLGDAVADVLGLDEIDRQARALAHRIAEEEAAEAERLQRTATLARIDELLDAAFAASAGKARVPGIVTEYLAWSRERADRRVFGDQLHMIRERLTQQHAQRRADRVRGSLVEVDRVVREHAAGVLADVARVWDVLEQAGIDPADPAERVLDVAPGVAQQWREWRVLVDRWGDVQSVRRWLLRATLCGFSEQRPTDLDVIGSTEAEAASWRTQFAGLEVGVPGADAALRLWVRGGRPAPAGVGATGKVVAG